MSLIVLAVLRARLFCHVSTRHHSSSVHQGLPLCLTGTELEQASQLPPSGAGAGAGLRQATGISCSLSASAELSGAICLREQTASDSLPALAWSRRPPCRIDLLDGSRRHTAGNWLPESAVPEPARRKLAPASPAAHLPQAVPITFHKEGAVSDPGNCRPIALHLTIYKLNAR